MVKLDQEDKMVPNGNGTLSYATVQNHGVHYRFTQYCESEFPIPSPKPTAPTASNGEASNDNRTPASAPPPRPPTLPEKIHEKRVALKAIKKEHIYPNRKINIMPTVGRA
jgi:hypothetical protein